VIEINFLIGHASLSYENKIKICQDNKEFDQSHAGVAYMDQKHGSTRTYKYVGQVTHNANAFA